MFMSSPKFLTPKVMVLRDGDFVSDWAVRQGALMNEMNVLIKETPENSLVSSARSDYR